MFGWTVGILKYSRSIRISSLPYHGDDVGSDGTVAGEAFEMALNNGNKKN